MIKKTYVINGKKFASVPDYLEKNGLMCPVTSDNFTIQIVETEIDDLEIKQAAAIAKNKFTKLQIRRAMRSLGIEAILDELLTNEAFAKDWADAIEIDLSDPMTAQAMNYVNVDINAVKIAISNL